MDNTVAIIIVAGVSPDKFIFFQTLPSSVLCVSTVNIGQLFSHILGYFQICSSVFFCQILFLLVLLFLFVYCFYFAILQKCQILSIRTPIVASAQTLPTCVGGTLLCSDMFRCKSAQAFILQDSIASVVEQTTGIVEY